jgi:hypothetical protein
MTGWHCRISTDKHHAVIMSTFMGNALLECRTSDVKNQGFQMSGSLRTKGLIHVIPGSERRRSALICFVTASSDRIQSARRECVTECARVKNKNHTVEMYVLGAQATYGKKSAPQRTISQCSHSGVLHNWDNSGPINRLEQIVWGADSLVYQFGRSQSEMRWQTRQGGAESTIAPCTYPRTIRVVGRIVTRSQMPPSQSDATRAVRCHPRSRKRRWR